MRSLARRDAKPRVGEGPYELGRNPDCDVVYFHGAADVLRRGDLRARVGIKETAPDRLVCYCLRVTEAAILAEVAEKRCCTTLEEVELATRARTGKACVYEPLRPVLRPRGSDRHQQGPRQCRPRRPRPAGNARAAGSRPGLLRRG